MKPLSLSFSGIGPYPGRVEINFSELNPKGLYLIVGPTGAGKTTLFDAMAYALYGRVASDRASDIVSAYENRLPPEIEFKFSHGDRTYVVHRELATPSKPSVPSKQWLREFSLNGEELNAVTGAKAVSEKCSGVIGLNVDEFLQVILLLAGGYFFFGLNMPTDISKWFTFTWLIILGTATSTVLGIAFSRVPKSGRGASAVVSPVVIVLQFFSGVFFIFTQLPSWMQQIAAIFPLKWLTQGMRSVFLPDSFAGSEIAKSWETGRTFLVLSIWLVVGFFISLRTFKWSRD
jgi:energy-coupling factor transporter ATP-binding protein EcfA2